MVESKRFVKVMDNAGFVLTEAAVSERLRRMEGITLHPMLFNTPLIYDDNGKKAMEEIYGQYRAIALEARVPLLLCAPTWRLDRDRIAQADMSENLIKDAVSFMLSLRDKWDDPNSPVLVGGLMGPKNDCYQPQEGLAQEDALTFHSWQANKLAEAKVDVLLAQTMPAVGEATGMARAMANAGLPYIISFVINRRGNVFDGTPLAKAVETMDATLPIAPYGYMVNCSYPTFICADAQPPALFNRLLGIQANSSSKDQTELDGSAATLRDSMEEWIDEMLILHKKHGMKLMGGCCGTDDRYLAGIVHG